MSSCPGDAAIAAAKMTQGYLLTHTPRTAPCTRNNPSEATGEDPGKDCICSAAQSLGEPR